MKTYNKRAGIEGSISQGVRRSALRQSRYIGLAKTHLQRNFQIEKSTKALFREAYSDFKASFTGYNLSEAYLKRVLR